MADVTAADRHVYSPKMKVLRIIARLNVGGPARHVVWLTEALSGGGFESTLIAGTVPPGEEDMGYLADQCGIRPVFIREMSRELSPKDAVSFLKVLREMYRLRPDIIHTHTAKAGTVGRAAAFVYKYLTPGTLIGRPRNVRVVHTFHGHVFHSYYGRAKTRAFIAIERALARFASDAIITITEQQLDEINGRFRVGRRDQFHVIPLGIDLGPFSDIGPLRDDARRGAGASENETVVGFVGRLTEIKNIPMLLRAASAAIGSPGEDAPQFRFIIAGDGHLRAGLERDADELGLSGRVVFLGNREDTPAVYAACDIVALTSLNEGTPLSLIEAMAAGRPVISTRVGGVSDLLGRVEEERDGFEICERGIAVPSGDADALAKGLIYLAKDERLRERLSAAGRSFVAQKYSKDRLISDIRELYRRLSA